MNSLGKGTGRHQTVNTPNIHIHTSSNLLQNSKPFFGGSTGAGRTPSSFRSSSAASSSRMWTERDQGPSTLRLKVEASKNSEWAQIISADLKNYRSEQAFVKQAKRRAAKKYADEIRRTIELRATRNNPDIEKQQKLQWSQVLQDEQAGNNAVHRPRSSETRKRP